MPKSNNTRQNNIVNSREIYMDYAAGAEPNPGSIHYMGVSAKKSLENARNEVAHILNARAQEIIFTSGGTESNNLAIQGAVFAWHEKFADKKSKNKTIPHIITTNIEHPSVLETCKMLEKRNLANISIVPVEQNGIVDPKKIKKEIKGNTVLVSAMYANNEIGSIQPIIEIAKEIRHYKKNKKNNFSNSPFPFFHTDAVQAVHYIDINTEKLGVDLMSFSGAKISGAGRVGVLFKKSAVNLSPVFYGGDQEFGLRPGTENTEAIISFSRAFKKIRFEKEKESKRLQRLRDYFINKLTKMSKSLFDSEGGVIINGDSDETKNLPNIVSVTFSKILSELLVIELSAKGVMCSSKSACKSSQKGGSYVIQAINPNLDPEIGAVRFSFGKDTKKEDIDYTVKTLKNILSKLKKWYS